jgi:hypothetical protein
MSLVERLRDPKFDCADEAADEIERLRGQIALLVADIHRYREEIERLRRSAG